MNEFKYTEEILKNVEIELSKPNSLEFHNILKENLFVYILESNIHLSHYYIEEDTGFDVGVINEITHDLIKNYLLDNGRWEFIIFFNNNLVNYTKLELARKTLLNDMNKLILEENRIYYETDNLNLIHGLCGILFLILILESPNSMV